MEKTKKFVSMSRKRKYISLTTFTKMEKWKKEKMLALEKRKKCVSMARKGKYISMITLTKKMGKRENVLV